MQHPVVSALSSIGRRFIGGFQQARHGHIRGMSKDEIEQLSTLTRRPSFGPARIRRVLNEETGKMDFVRHQGHPIPVRFGTLAPYRPLPAPHIGAKERARHAGKPDGLMHKPTPDLRSNDFKRAEAATQQKKARAKKSA